MSTGSSGSSRPPENWQPGQEYLIYFPTTLSDYLPARTSLNPRGRTRDAWWFLEERSIGGPNYGLSSFSPAAAPRRSSSPLPLTGDYDYTYPQRSTVESESNLSPEEQKQALGKLRKQLYSPHISNIVRRLGTGRSAGSSASGDGDGKRCAVCLEDFETKQFVTITPCDHMFHEDCIVPWVKSHGKCPVCRFDIADKNPPQRGRSSAGIVAGAAAGGGGRDRERMTALLRSSLSTF